MHPMALVILFEMAWWAIQKGLKFVVTDSRTTLEEDNAITQSDQKGRVSKSHRDGRAWDIRLRDWPENLIKEFIDHFTKKYGHLGAIGATSGQRTLIKRHYGTADHLHCQLDTTFIAKVNLTEVLYELDE